MLCLSVLLSRPGDFRRAVEAASALRDEGWDSAARLARSLHADRVRVLRAHGQRGDVDGLADVLGDLARVVVDHYRGDLRRLRAEAHQDPARERRMLTDLPGVDDEVADLFLREAQACGGRWRRWPTVGPWWPRAGWAWAGPPTTWPPWPAAANRSGWPGWSGRSPGWTWRSGTRS